MCNFLLTHCNGVVNKFYGANAFTVFHLDSPYFYTGFQRLGLPRIVWRGPDLRQSDLRGLSLANQIVTGYYFQRLVTSTTLTAAKRLSSIDTIQLIDTKQGN